MGQTLTRGIYPNVSWLSDQATPSLITSGRWSRTWTLSTIVCRYINRNSHSRLRPGLRRGLRSWFWPLFMYGCSVYNLYLRAVVKADTDTDTKGAFAHRLLPLNCCFRRFIQKTTTSGGATLFSDGCLQARKHFRGDCFHTLNKERNRWWLEARQRINKNSLICKWYEYVV